MDIRENKIMISTFNDFNSCLFLFIIEETSFSKHTWTTFMNVQSRVKGKQRLGYCTEKEVE